MSPVTENIAYIAKYKATQTGFQIKVTDYTKKAVLSVDTEKYYRGTVNFTVEAKKACVVALKKADGSYERLYCTTTDDNKNFFTVTVTNADVEIYMAYKGDVNLDGKVSTKDSTILAKAAVGIKTIDSFQQLERVNINIYKSA